MNTTKIVTHLFSFVLGTYTGHTFCKKSMERLSKGEKLSIDFPGTVDEVKNRIPKAVTAAAKEIVDPKTIEIK